jgi:hypothetical protein
VGAVFVWRYFDGTGAEAGGSKPHETREDAEAWMGERWSMLLDQGIAEVALAEDRTEGFLYRMKLRAESD